MTIDELLDDGERHAHKILIERREPQLQAFYHLIGPGRSMILPCTWQNDLQKQLTVAAVKDMALEIAATHAMFIGEAWMVELKTAADYATYDGTPPSQRPDRIEVVQLCATDGEAARGRKLQIVRDKPGGRIISLIKGADDDHVLDSRLIEGIIAAKKRTIH